MIRSISAFTSSDSTTSSITRCATPCAIDSFARRTAWSPCVSPAHPDPHVPVWRTLTGPGSFARGDTRSGHPAQFSHPTAARLAFRGRRRGCAGERWATPTSGRSGPRSAVSGWAQPLSAGLAGTDGTGGSAAAEQLDAVTYWLGWSCWCESAVPPGCHRSVPNRPEALDWLVPKRRSPSTLKSAQAPDFTRHLVGHARRVFAIDLTPVCERCSRRPVGPGARRTRQGKCQFASVSVDVVIADVVALGRPEGGLRRSGTRPPKAALRPVVDRAGSLIDWVSRSMTRNDDAQDRQQIVPRTRRRNRPQMPKEHHSATPDAWISWLMVAHCRGTH